MKVYLITIILVIIFSNNLYGHIKYVENNEKIKYDDYGQIVTFLCGLVLMFVAGFRWKVGTDFGNYMLMYERVKSTWFDLLMLFDEPGIGIIAKVGSLFYDHPISMFILASIVTVSLYVITIKKYSYNFQLSILLYIFVGAWHGAFNGIRQYLAAAVLFAGHRFIYEKKIWKYVLVVLVAMMFHRTAIVMLPVYFLANGKLSIKNIGIVVVSVVAIRYSYDNLLSVMSFFKGTDQSQYAYMTSDVNGLRVAVAFAPLLIALLATRTGILHNKETQFYVMLLIINAGFMFGTSGSAYLARVGIYTEMYATLAFPRIIQCLDEKSKKLMVMLIYVLYFVFWFYELSARGLTNFQWCFKYI